MVTLNASARSAHHAFGDKVADLAWRSSRIRQHGAGVFAEFRRRLRNDALLRSKRIGEATPLYQSFSMISPRCLVWALVSALSIDCTGPAGRPALSRRSHSGSTSCSANTARVRCAAPRGWRRGPCCGQTRVGAELRLADLLGQLRNCRRCRRRGRSRRRASGRSHRARFGMLVAGQLRRLAGHEIVCGCGCISERPLSYSVVSRNWPLPERCALVERHQDADRGIEAGGDVDQRHADAHRPAFRVPVDAIMPVIAWMMAS